MHYYFFKSKSIKRWKPVYTDFVSKVHWTVCIVVWKHDTKSISAYVWLVDRCQKLYIQIVNCCKDWEKYKQAYKQSHYTYVGQWAIFMEQKLRFERFFHVFMCNTWRSGPGICSLICAVTVPYFSNKPQTSNLKF